LSPGKAALQDGGVPRVTPLLFLCFLLPGGLASASGARGATDPVTATWEFVARHLPEEAAASVRTAPVSGDREAALARAVVLMDATPVSDRRLEDVAAQLEELARGDDEIAQAAGYLTGRLYQAHFYRPDFPRAAHAYEALAARHPGGYWAQLGLVKLALLQLYVLAAPEAPEARIAAAETLLPRVTIPELQCDLHIVLGRARLFHGQPLGGVLAHLLAADRIGGLTGLKRAELLVQIAELSRRAGQPAQARAYFQRFMAENEVDARVYTVKAILAEMDRAGPAAEGRP
jgi:hypothetical protein